jgi:hypothetical protein
MVGNPKTSPAFVLKTTLANHAAGQIYAALRYVEKREILKGKILWNIVRGE